LNQYDLAYQKKQKEFLTKKEASDNLDIDPNDTLKLNQGRFRGANVPRVLVDKAVESAQKTGVPVGKILSLIGRESAFGSGRENGGLRALVSGWNVAEKYSPTDYNKFLSAQGVPGMTMSKDAHGYSYYQENPDAVRMHLEKHPELLARYQQSLNQTPDIGNLNSLDLAAEKIKREGVAAYNPGDPKYEAMYNKDYAMLSQEQELQNYLKKRGVKFKMGGKYRKKC
jgi:hypothetical protein